MTYHPDFPKRSAGWWTYQLVSLAALVGFFFALWAVLKAIAPERLP